MMVTRIDARDGHLWGVSRDSGADHVRVGAEQHHPAEPVGGLADQLVDRRAFQLPARDPDDVGVAEQ